MERIIAQNRDEIMLIIRTSKNTQSACSQIQRQFEVGYIKAQQIINYLSMSPLQIQSQSSMFNDLIKIPERNLCKPILLLTTKLYNIRPSLRFFYKGEQHIRREPT
jgi:hypothetical protein